MKPVGAVVSITYDSEETLSPGDWLRTPTDRGYLIVAVRTVQRGPNAGRRHQIRAVVHDEVPPEVRVHPLYWHSRAPKRSRPG